MSSSTREGAEKKTPSHCPGGGHIEEQRIAAGRLDLLVACGAPTTIVVKLSYHPNWSVDVDGQRVQPFMVSPSFLGATIPARSHTVRIEYQAPAWKMGLLLIGGGVLTVILLFGKRFEALDKAVGGPSRRP
jgi:hypothetical protein